MKQRRAIRKIVIRASIFLMLGAIVNIAVAWGCAVHADLINWQEKARSKFEATWPLTPSKPWPPPSKATYVEDFGYRQESAYFSPQLPRGSRVMYFRQVTFLHVMQVRTIGWPLHSLRSVWESESQGNIPANLVNGYIHASFEFGIGRWLAPPSTHSTPRWIVLPWRPLWPGFAINTLFYAAILWLLFTLPRALRRWRRIKRGLCPACAYPVGASDLCTECGKPVNPRSRKASSSEPALSS